MTRTDDPSPGLDVLTACVELVGRTGATSVQVRCCNEEEPTVWMVVADYGDRWEVAAGQAPHVAAFRLVERLVDGGQCKHCERPTGVSMEFDRQLLDSVICWYKWDPELRKFRRSCEGD
jgi:hypothetical protein